MITLKGAVWKQGGHAPRANQLLVRLDVSDVETGQNFTASSEVVQYGQPHKSFGEMAQAISRAEVVVEGTPDQVEAALKAVGGVKIAKRNGGNGWIIMRIDAEIAKLPCMPTGVVWNRVDHEMGRGVALYVQDDEWHTIRKGLARRAELASKVARESPRWAAIGGNPADVVETLQKLREEGEIKSDLCFRKWDWTDGTLDITMGRIANRELLFIDIADARLTQEAVATITSAIIGQTCEARVYDKYTQERKEKPQAERVAEVMVPKSMRKLLVGMSYDFAWCGQDLRVTYRGQRAAQHGGIEHAVTDEASRAVKRQGPDDDREPGTPGKSRTTKIGALVHQDPTCHTSTQGLKPGVTTANHGGRVVTDAGRTSQTEETGRDLTQGRKPGVKSKRTTEERRNVKKERTEDRGGDSGEGPVDMTSDENYASAASEDESDDAAAGPGQGGYMDVEWQPGEVIEAERMRDEERVLLKVVGPNERGDGWVVEPATQAKAVNITQKDTA
ncbi:MAG: hypothetical protein ABGY24_09525, partial [bacterium]